MKRILRWIAVVPLVACLQPLGCRKAPEDTGEEAKAAEVEHLEGAEPARVKLTEEAVKRLDIQTDTVRETDVKGKQRKVIPYAAILYDTQGDTWTYTNPEPLTYFRHPIAVDHIVGELAFLSDGPASGTAVVTVGAAELYGSELEFEEE
jgi:hypothetical protein